MYRLLALLSLALLVACGAIPPNAPLPAGAAINKPSANAPLCRSALSLAGTGFKSIFEMSYASCAGGAEGGLQAASETPVRTAITRRPFMTFSALLSCN